MMEDIGLWSAAVYFALPAHYALRRVLTVTPAGGSGVSRGTSGAAVAEMIKSGDAAII
jgi:hypothetical protein